MVMAAILVMWTRPFEGTWVPPTHAGTTNNLASIGPVASEEKMVKNVVDWRTADAYLCYKLTNEPSTQVSS